VRLSEGQLDALRNLAHKRGGELVGWISIPDAQELTELGLAIRTRSGWEITEAGLAALNGEAARPPSDGVVVRPQFGPRPPPED
jgi:hypothetical protein